MKYPSNRLGLVVTASLIGLFALTTSSAGLDVVARAWPNFTEKSSDSVCMDGTCLEVSAFQRRKLCIPQDHLRRDQVEHQVLNTDSKEADITERIHLFYNQETAPLPDCEGCHPNETLDLVLLQFGPPQQIALYKRQEMGETVTLIEKEEVVPFLKGRPLR